MGGKNHYKEEFMGYPTFEKRLEQILADLKGGFFNREDIHLMINELGKSSEQEDKLLRDELVFALNNTH